MNELIQLHDESDKYITEINEFIDRQPQEFLFTDIHTLLIKIVLFNHKQQKTLVEYAYENSEVL